VVEKSKKRYSAADLDDDDDMYSSSSSMYSTEKFKNQGLEVSFWVLVKREGWDLNRR